MVERSVLRCPSGWIEHWICARHAGSRLGQDLGAGWREPECLCDAVEI